MPPGEEQKARAFYADVPGMMEVPKPPELAKPGGCWFASGSVQLHLGVESGFGPAKKAHPSLRCRDDGTLLQRLRDGRIEVNQPDDIPGVRRCHVHDPLGNRRELIGG